MHQLIEQNCIECGKPFKTRRYEVEHGRGKFCSHVCARRYDGKTKRKFVDKLCPICDKIFSLNPSRAKKRTYCSVKCSNKGHTSLIKKKRPRKSNPELSKQYREKLKAEVILILGDKCFICGRKRRIICHRKSGEPHSTGNTFRMVLDNPDEWVRLDEWCHKAVHWNMEYFNMPWEEIIERLKYLKKV